MACIEKGKSIVKVPHLSEAIVIFAYCIFAYCNGREGLLNYKSATLLFLFNHGKNFQLTVKLVTNFANYEVGDHSST